MLVDTNRAKVAWKYTFFKKLLTRFIKSSFCFGPGKPNF